MKSAFIRNASQATDKTEKWLLGLLLLAALLAYHKLITEIDTSIFLPTVVGSFFSYSGTAPQFLYLLVIGLFYIRRKDIAKACQGPGAPWTAQFYLLPGILLFLWGQYVGVTDILHISLLLTGLGVAHLLSGRRLTLAILPPVLILVLATPIPAVLLNQILFQFQLWDAEHTAWILNAIGISSVPVGDLIYMAGGSARVAESCTALGFLKWLTIFALAYVYVFPASRLHAVILVLSAPLIAYAVNILRAFSLVLNPKLEVLSIHMTQGILFFMIGFSLLYALDSFLLRVFGKQTNRQNDASAEPNAITRQKRRPIQGLIAIFLILFSFSLAMPQWSFPPGNMHRFDLSLAEEFGEWNLRSSPPIYYPFLGSVRYSAMIFRDYLREKNEPVSLFIGYDDRLQRLRSMLSDKNTYLGERGFVEERSSVTLGSSGHQATSIIVYDSKTRFLVYSWYQGVSSLGKEFLYALLALDQSPFRRAEPALVVRLSAMIYPGAEGLKLADKRLRDFLADLNKAKQNSSKSKKKGPKIIFGPASPL